MWKPAFIFRPRSVSVVAVLLLAGSIGFGMGTAEAKLGGKLWNEGYKFISKTALKKHLPKVKVAVTAYERAMAIVKGITVVSKAGPVLMGMILDQPWAIAYTNVLPEGRDVQTDTDELSALATSEQSNPFGTAESRASASRIGNTIDVSGSSSKAAAWLAVAGHGAKNIVYNGATLGTIVLEATDFVLDPYNESIFNFYDEETQDREVQLLSPCGFDLIVRAYYPTEMDYDTGPVYFEAEVFGFLEMVDENAAYPQDGIKPTVYAIADCYDRNGAIIDHREGTDVCNLTRDSFAYFEETVNDVTVFGYRVQDFACSLYVNAPDNWGEIPEYGRVDCQVIVGGESAGGAPPEVFQDTLTLIEQGQPQAYVPFSICNPNVLSTYGFNITSRGYIGSAINQSGLVEVKGGDCENVYGVIDASATALCTYDTLTIVSWTTTGDPVLYDTCVQLVHVVEQVEVPSLIVPVLAIFIIGSIGIVAIVIWKRSSRVT